MLINILYGGIRCMEEKKQQAIANRFARIEGHVRKVKEMVQEGRDESDIMVQLKAVQKALQGAEKELFKEQLIELVPEGNLKLAYEKVDAFLK